MHASIASCSHHQKSCARRRVGSDNAVQISRLASTAAGMSAVPVLGGHHCLRCSLTRPAAASVVMPLPDVTQQHSTVQSRLHLSSPPGMADMLQLPATARTQPNTAAIDNLQPISDDDAEPLTLGSHRLTSPLDRLSFMQLQSSCCSSSSSNAASSSPSLSQQETASVVCSAPTYSSLNRQQPNPSATATNNKGQLLARLASRKVAGREATALLHPTSPHTAISPDGKQANTRVVTHRKRRRQLRYVLTEACLQQGGTDSASPAHAWLPEDLLVDLTGQTSQPPLSSNQRQHMLRLGTLCKHGGLSFEVSRAVLTKCMESALNNNPEEPQRCMPTLTQLVAKYGELTVTEWMKRFPGVRRHTVDEVRRHIS